MNKGGSKLILTEFIIVVFMLVMCSNVLVQLFAAAGITVNNSKILTAATDTARETWEIVYAADDYKAALINEGYEETDGVYIKSFERYYAVFSEICESPLAGRIYCVETKDNSELISLEIAKYTK